MPLVDSELDYDRLCKIIDSKKARIHFIGIGGVSVYSLARFVLGRNKSSISGSDVQESSRTAKLSELGAKIFISQLVESSAGSLQSFLPAIIFVIAVGLSFATGTSWGTFGILIPIVLSVFEAGNPLTIVAISACMAGAVCGDHCSPISDTTIMASAGAQCDHLNHVSTQLPYALTVAGVSFVSYIIAGFVPNWMISLPIALVLMIATLFVVNTIAKKKAQ